MPNIKIPILKELKVLRSDYFTYGNMKKMRVNSKYIVRLSDFNRINIWSAQDLILIQTLKPGSGVLTNIWRNIASFNFATYNQDLLGIVFDINFVIYNMNTKIIIDSYKNPNSIFWRQVYLTNNYITFLDQTYTIFRVDRITKTVSYTFNSDFLSQPKGQLCQNPLTNIDILTLYTVYNRLKIFKCINSQKVCNLILETNFENVIMLDDISHITFAKSCNLVYSEANTYRNSEIINVFNRTSAKFPIFSRNILYFSKLDDNVIYSFFFFADGAFQVYKGTSTKVYEVKHNFGLWNIQLLEFIQFDMYKNQIFVGFKNQIKIYRFECENLYYMSQNNICSLCTMYCISCSNITGQCYQCASDYNLQNGICVSIYGYTTNNTMNNSQSTNTTQNSSIIFNETTFNQTFSNNSSNYTQNNQTNSTNQEFIEFTEIQELNPQLRKYLESIKQFNKNIAKITRIFRKSPAGWFFLGFIKFWSIVTIYVQINMFIPIDLMKILKQTYDIINYSIFQSFNIFQNIPQQLQGTYTQKYQLILTVNFGLSSNFIVNNYQPLMITGFYYSFYLILYFLSKFIKNKIPKNSFWYRGISLNYFKVFLLQLATIIGPFLYGISIIIQKSYYNQYQQKINIINIILSLYVAISVPFFLTLTIKHIYVAKNKQQKNKQQNFNKHNKNMKKSKIDKKQKTDNQSYQLQKSKSNIFECKKNQNNQFQNQNFVKKQFRNFNQESLFDIHDYKQMNRKKQIKFLKTNKIVNIDIFTQYYDQTKNRKNIKNNQKVLLNDNNQKQKQKQKHYQNQYINNKLQKYNYYDEYQIFFDSFSSIIMPLFASLCYLSPKFIPYFFFFTFLFYLFGVYIGFLTPKYKINTIILNSHYVTFHLTLFVIWFLTKYIDFKDKKKYQQIVYYLSVFALIIFTLGAAHQILFLLFQIFKQLISKIRSFIGKKKRIKSQSNKQIQKNNFENIKNTPKTNKVKYKQKVSFIKYDNESNESKKITQTIEDIDQKMTQKQKTQRKIFMKNVLRGKKVNNNINQKQKRLRQTQITQDQFNQNKTNILKSTVKSAVRPLYKIISSNTKYRTYG